MRWAYAEALAPSTADSVAAQTTAALFIADFCDPYRHARRRFDMDVTYSTSSLIASASRFGDVCHVRHLTKLTRLHDDDRYSGRQL
jgi:hypothetical protein